MVNFCNPGVLGTPAEFRRKYERPILEGREPGVGPEKVLKLQVSSYIKTCAACTDKNEGTSGSPLVLSSCSAVSWDVS